MSRHRRQQQRRHRRGAWRPAVRAEVERLYFGDAEVRRMDPIERMRQTHTFARVLGEGEAIDVARAARGMSPRGRYY